jgi:hypothetical protein
MKTAMQFLIDELDLQKIIDRDKLVMVEYIINQALEKEKEQIINFHKWMLKNDTAENAEQYFHYSDDDMFNEYLKTNNLLSKH